MKGATHSCLFVFFLLFVLKTRCFIDDFLKNLVILFIFGCVGSLLLRAGFSLVAESGGYSSLWCTSFSLGGLSCCRTRALGARASVVVARGL